MKRKFCQSCGMPMDMDPDNGGTQKQGSKSGIYCSYCYRDGEFTFNGTVKEMQEFCRRKMIEGGHSKFKVWLFTRGLKRLERWKN